MSIGVFLIARPQFDLQAFLEFLHREGTSWHRTDGAKPAEELVEVAGRVCYLSFGQSQCKKANSEFITSLIRKGHDSVLEHVSWTFIVTGVSRALSHQLVRHRIGFSFSQLSQQYHDETAARFIEPPEVSDSPELHSIWENAVRVARCAYDQIKESLEGRAGAKSQIEQTRSSKRLARSIARSVLPNATETKIVLTANARAFRHFFEVRGQASNDSEIRLLAASLLRQMKEEAPALFSDFQMRALEDGSVEVIRVDDA